MLTDREKEQHTGKVGWLETGNYPRIMQVPVVVVDMREVYGRRQALVKPIGSTSEVWVDVGRIIIREPEQILPGIQEELDRLQAIADATRDGRPCPACADTMNGKLDAEGICEACGWRVQ